MSTRVDSDDLREVDERHCELAEFDFSFYLDDECEPDNATEVTIFDAQASEEDLVTRWITIEREFAVKAEDWR